MDRPGALLSALLAGDTRIIPQSPPAARFAPLVSFQRAAVPIIKPPTVFQVAITDGTVALLDVTSGTTLFSRRIFATSTPPGVAPALPRAAVSPWTARLHAGYRPPPAAVAVRLSPDCSRLAATGPDNTIEVRACQTKCWPACLCRLARDGGRKPLVV